MMALPSPREVINNFEQLTEWLVFVGLIVAIVIGVLTIGQMLHKRRQRKNEEKE